MKREVAVLWRAACDPRTPLFAAQALHPVNPIPNIISILNYLDGVVIVPLGILLAVRPVHQVLWRSCEFAAQTWSDHRALADLVLILVLGLTLDALMA